MHGVPKDLDLSKFKGTSLVAVIIGEMQVQFGFHPEGRISAYGEWMLTDSTGNVLDAMQDNSKRDAYYLHRILGKSVRDCELDAPHSFSLVFDSGHKLTLFDDLGPYECISIQPGDIHL